MKKSELKQLIREIILNEAKYDNAEGQDYRFRIDLDLLPSKQERWRNRMEIDKLLGRMDFMFFSDENLGFNDKKERDQAYKLLLTKNFTK